jgi:hypothetical protein
VIESRFRDYMRLCSMAVAFINTRSEISDSAVHINLITIYPYWVYVVDSVSVIGEKL